MGQVIAEDKINFTNDEKQKPFWCFMLFKIKQKTD